MRLLGSSKVNYRVLCWRGSRQDSGLRRSTWSVLAPACFNSDKRWTLRPKPWRDAWLVAVSAWHTAMYPVAPVTNTCIRILTPSPSVVEAPSTKGQGYHELKIASFRFDGWSGTHRHTECYYPGFRCHKNVADFREAQGLATHVANRRSQATVSRWI